MSSFYAHTKEGKPPEEWQTLEAHLEGVAGLAESFASQFGCGGWGWQAGLWHDLGKYSDAFQKYLVTASSPDPHKADFAPRTDHSTAGAQHAVSEIEILGHLIAYVVSGHHAGLLDAIGEGACLDARLGKRIEPFDEAPSALLRPATLQVPPFVEKAFGNHDGFSIAFFTRMLFSCLVDADFLDTERFVDPERAASRPTWPMDILEKMEKALTSYVRGLNPDDNRVNRARALVREDCLKAAGERPGLFSLTVPTGGGKTLSSLAFALRHAIQNRFERIIYVLPFTTIIEQNADRFRDALAQVSSELGLDPVLEHHSNFDIEKETTQSRLATQNWDAPLIVTTSVQFYESLFSNRTSHCRKLHNLAKSVINLDEVQNLPVDYLHPCLRAIEELSRNYAATIVLCTATQPAVEKRENFPIGLEKVREIVRNPPELYRKLKRVEVKDTGQISDEDLVERLLEEDRVLCIVNTRGHARKLFEALKREGDDCYHLSALMCPAHRSCKLDEIRKNLESGKTCRVISTQLIEAGVDIDFPVVYRSLAGLDSIAQAAGRCNREGKSDAGRTCVFRSEHHRSESYFADTANVASQVLPLFDDPLALETVEHYFKLYYWDQSSRWDGKKILQRFALQQNRGLPFLFSFATTAAEFHLIEDHSREVIIPWGNEGKKLCERLRRVSVPVPREILRKLQRYTVRIPIRTWNKHAEVDIELVHDRYPVLICPERQYNKSTGLSLEVPDENAIFA